MGLLYVVATFFVFEKRDFVPLFFAQKVSKFAKNGIKRNHYFFTRVLRCKVILLSFKWLDFL